MRRSLAVLATLAAVAACADTQDPTTPEPAFSNGYGPGAAAVYALTFTNMTSTQPMTPPAAALHDPSIRLFEVGQPANVAIQQIAENGNLAPAVELLSGSDHVADLGVAFGPTIDPLLPGESSSIELHGSNGAKWVSWAAMLICTNDGFTGSSLLRLPKKVGDSVEAYTSAYDAGTEINTEDFADLVPPCPALTGVVSEVPGTGMSNPALAENGVIHHHDGIQGGADLDPAIHGWTDPVAKVVVTRIQ